MKICHYNVIDGFDLEKSKSEVISFVFGGDCHKTQHFMKGSSMTAYSLKISKLILERLIELRLLRTFQLFIPQLFLINLLD